MMSWHGNIISGFPSCGIDYQARNDFILKLSQRYFWYNFLEVLNQTGATNKNKNDVWNAEIPSAT